MWLCDLSRVVTSTSALVALLPACAAENVSIGTGEHEDPVAGSTTAAPQPPDFDTGSASVDGGDDSGSVFIEPTDVGADLSCDVWTQDCPAGQKCSPWANDGGSAHNAAKCVDVVDEPDAAEQPCTLIGDWGSGEDSCERGAMCWHVDPKTQIGTCRSFCGHEWDCEDPSRYCGGNRFFPICLPSCCPREQDCGDSQGCYPDGDAFFCGPDASGDLGKFGDPCEFLNACAPGLACLGAAAFPDCQGSAGCCSPFCDLGSSQCTLMHPDLECRAWYDPDEVPPGLEHLGVCVVPEQ